MVKAKEKISALVEETNNIANRQDLSIQQDYFKKKAYYTALNDDLINEIYKNCKSGSLDAKRIAVFIELQKINLDMMTDAMLKE